MILPRVYVVGWKGKVWMDVFAIFADLDTAMQFQREVRKQFCPNGSDRDDSFLLERDLLLKLSPGERVDSEELLDSLLSAGTHLSFEAVVEVGSECSLL